jgi:hypothetical protein
MCFLAFRGSLGNGLGNTAPPFRFVACPSARLFRQRRVHDWAPVFEQMAAALRELVARRRVEAA